MNTYKVFPSSCDKCWGLNWAASRIWKTGVPTAEKKHTSVALFFIIFLLQSSLWPLLLVARSPSSSAGRSTPCIGGPRPPVPDPSPAAFTHAAGPPAWLDCSLDTEQFLLLPTSAPSPTHPPPPCLEFQLSCQNPTLGHPQLVCISLILQALALDFSHFTVLPETWEIPPKPI